MTSADWLANWPGICPQESLAKHNQYGIGGPAEWFIKVKDYESLIEFLPRCSNARIPVTSLGAGSNALILDEGIKGLTIKLVDRKLTIIDETTVELSGGYMMPRAALDLAKQGIGGLEFGIGVPGTCGASVRGNAGAFGCEIKDILMECTTIDSQGQIRVWSKEECNFAYRDSRFKAELNDHIVVAAKFRVHSENPSVVRQRTDNIQAQRKSTQPYGIRSLGSVFKNPPGDHAGRLIEVCDLKGKTHGGAQISPKHANFIVNQQQASAHDVLALIELAHKTVSDTFNIDLELEISILGNTTPYNPVNLGGAT